MTSPTSADYSLSVDIVPDASNFGNRLRAALQKIKPEPTAKVAATPDTSKFAAQLRAALGAVNMPAVKVSATPNLAGFSARLRSELSSLPTVSARVMATPSTTGFNASLRSSLAALPTLSHRVNLAPSTAGFNAAARTSLAGLPTLSTRVRIDPDVAGFEARLRAALSAMPPVFADIQLSPDVSGFRARLLAALAAMPNASVQVTLTMPTATATGARIGREAARVFVLAFNSAMASANWGSPGPGPGASGAAGARSGGAYAATFRQVVTAALSNLPEPTIGAATGPFDQAMRDVRLSLERLAGERVGVTIDATQARAEADRIRADLTRLRAMSPIDVDVEANIRAAELALAGLEARLAAIGRDRTANVRVNANASQLNALQTAILGSTSRMQLLITAGLALGPAIVPAAAAATAAIAAIGGAAISAGAGLGVGVLAISGIVGAVRALNEAHNDQAKTGATLARQDKQLAGGADQVRSAVASLANTRAQAASQARQSAQSIADAERGLADAQRDYLRVQQDINRAREEAKDALEDLDSAIKGNATSIKQANLDYADAQAALAKVASLPVDDRRRVEAEIAFERAKQQLDDLTVRQGRLAEEKQRADKVGIEGSTQVVAAQERVSDAQKRVQDAERAVAEARVQAAEQARQSAFSIAQAQQAVIAAQRNVATAAVSTAATGGAAMDTLRAKLESLSPEGERFARFLIGLQPELLSLRRSAELALPGFQRGIEALLPSLPAVNDFVRRVAVSLGQMGENAGNALNSQRFRPFFSYIDATAVPTMEDLAISTGHIVAGIGNIVVAFGPMQRQLTGGLSDITDRFERWSGTLGENNNFQRFLDYAMTRGPVVLRTVSDIGGALIHLLEASAPAGDVVLSILSTLSHVIESIPVPVLTALLTTMTALRIASLLAAIPLANIGTTLSTLPGRVIAMTTSVGAAQAGMASFAATLGGPVTIAIAAATIGIGYLISQSAKQKAQTDSNVAALGQLAAAYRETGSLSSDRVGQIVKENKSLQDLALNFDRYSRGAGDINKALGLSKESAEAYGTSLSDLGLALDGNVDAQKRVLDVLATVAALSPDKKLAEDASARRTELERLFATQAVATAAEKKLAEAKQATAEATKNLTPAERALAEAHRVLGDESATAAQKQEALRNASEAMRTAAESQAEAQERYSRAVLNAKDALDQNGASLGFNTKEALGNRDALQEVIRASGEMYEKDIAAGAAVEQATARHQARIQTLINEAVKNGANRGEVEKLIATYDRVQPNVQTAFTSKGLNEVFADLVQLQIAQRALAEGISPQEAKNKYAGLYTTAHGRPLSDRGLATGGPVTGPGGPTEDKVPAFLATRYGNIPGYRLSPGEFVQPAATVDYYGQGFMEALRHRMLPRDFFSHGHGPRVGYATGGVVEWPYTVNVANTRIPTIDEVSKAVLDKITFAGGGNWPSSPSAQRGDSGVWRSVVALIKSTGPLSGTFGNAYRPGDPLWHGCVPMDTEVLTRRGWVRFEDVRIGEDETVGFNEATGRAEWTRIVGMYHYDDAELWTVEAGGWSADVTPGHKWLTTDGLVETRHLTAASMVRLSTRLAPEVADSTELIDSDTAVGGVARTAVRRAEVFCPTTTLGTWTARQRGGVFLTGNSGRAVDWMGFNQDALASFLAARRPLELIHRTGQRDYAYTRGKDKGSFNNTLMEQHRNHIHIAFADGGPVGIPNMASVLSGLSVAQVPYLMRDSGGYIPPGLSLVDNQTGRNEWVFNESQMQSLTYAATAGGSRRGGGVDVNIEHFTAASGQSPHEIARELNWLMKTGG